MGTQGQERQPQTSQDHRITRTRNRVPRSCQACRIRKLKCNREKPCQNCVVRGDTVATTCSYVATAAQKISFSKGVKPSPIDVRCRIDRLETLVRSLISQENELGIDNPSSNFGGKKDAGTLTKHFISTSNGVSEDLKHAHESSSPAGGQKLSIDTRSTHWDAILHDITAIKDAWGQSIELEGDSTDVAYRPPFGHRPSLLNGLTKPPDFQTLLASVPAKSAADKLIYRFFDSYNPAAPARGVLHKPTFLKQYDSHWKAPTKTTTIWLGMLFGVLAFAMQSYVRANEEPLEYEGTSKAQLELYRVRTAQCIVASDITRPQDHMIETLLLYSMVEYADQRDGEMGVWYLSGLIMRLALQQGYHRDPSLHPDISPFKAEMRRRIWTIVSQHEFLFSVQLGLPKMIRYSESDVAPPRNLHEEELYEDMKELPPSRPITESTEICYQITKARIMRAYGHVIEHLHVLQEDSYDSIMRLDAKLIEARDMIPPHLLPDANPPNETQGSIMEKYILQLFFHKGICVLHRKFLTTELNDDIYAYSRRTCIASSLAMLNHQVSLNSECQPGGRLPRMKWYQFSLMNHDYLLAAMVVCLALYNSKQQKATDSWNNMAFGNLSQQDEMLNAIQRAKDIWAEVAEHSPDGKRATRILTVISDKLAMTRPSTSTMDHTRIENLHQNSATKGALNDTKLLVPIMTDGPILTEKTPTQGTYDLPAFSQDFDNVDPLAQQGYDDSDLIYDNLFSSGKIFNSFEPNLNLPANVDWTAWDLYVNGAARLDLAPDETWPNDPSLDGSAPVIPFQKYPGWS